VSAGTNAADGSRADTLWVVPSERHVERWAREGRKVETRARLRERLFDELVRDRFLFGSPAEVTEQILDLQRRFGVNHMVVGVHWTGMPASLPLEQMHLLAEEVFPAVRAA